MGQLSLVIATLLVVAVSCDRFRLPDIGEDELDSIIDTVKDKLRIAEGDVTTDGQILVTTVAVNTTSNSSTSFTSEPQPTRRPRPTESDGRRPNRRRKRPPPPRDHENFRDFEDYSSSSTTFGYIDEIDGEGQTIIVAVAVPTAGAVLVAVIVAVSVLMYKSRKRSLNRNDVEGNMVYRKTAAGRPDPHPSLTNPRRSKTNDYTTNEAAYEEDVYQQLHPTESVVKQASPLNKRSGPLPRIPISVEEDDREHSFPETPLTPPRDGVKEDYYSYADHKTISNANSELEIKQEVDAVATSSDYVDVNQL